MGICNRYGIKKLRGGKRRLRHVAEWKERCREIDFERLKQAGLYYIRFWIHPWYSLSKPTPPLWLRREMLKAMIELAHGWHYQLIKSNEPLISKSGWNKIVLRELSWWLLAVT